MIEFKTQDINDADVNLSDFNDISSFVEKIKATVIKSTDQKRTKIRLKRPVHASCSIPNAFKKIVQLDEQLKRGEIIFEIIIHPLAKDHLITYLPNKLKPKYTTETHNLIVNIEIGDITNSKSEAIVNASNNNLRLGGGVSGAIKKAASPALQSELSRIARLQSVNDGDAVITSSFGIKNVKYIIHVATDVGTKQIVKKGIENVLDLANHKKISSITFPALATGAGGMKIEILAELFKEIIPEFLENETDTYVKTIAICLFNATEFEKFVDIFKK